jgi:hypothetical protein
MGNWTDIRGWLHHPEIPVYEAVRRLVETYIERGPYPRVWVLPRDPSQDWSYTFLGGEIRTQAVPDFREMIRAIAEGVSVPCWENDDDGSRLTVEGFIRCDSDQGEREEWECLDGGLTVRNSRTQERGGETP